MHLHLLEHPPGVEGRETGRRNQDHDTIEHDEISLALHDRVAPSLCHLSDTEDATGEDGDVSEYEAGDEKLEAAIVGELDGRGAPERALLAGTGDIVGDEEAEDDEGEDLPDDTGHHEVVARLLHGGSAVSGGGQASSSALEDEGEEIAKDEDPGVPLGTDAREFVADFEYDVFEGEIDAGGQEGGGDDQAANLDVEAVAGPGVGVEHDTTDVA